MGRRLLGRLLQLSACPQHSSSLATDQIGREVQQWLCTLSLVAAQQSRTFATRKDEEEAKKVPRSNTRWRKFADELLEDEQDAPDLLAEADRAKQAELQQQSAAKPEPAERLQQTYSQAETSQEARQQPEVAAQLHAAASAAADDASARPEAEGAAHRPGPGQAGAHATPARQRSRAQRQDRAAPRESQALQDRLRSISQPADSSTAADAQPLGATTVPDEQPVATSTAPDESAVRSPASQPLLSREEAIQALINLRPPIAPKASGRSAVAAADPEASAEAPGRLAIPEPANAAPSSHTGFAELGSSSQPMFSVAYNNTGRVNPHRMFLPGQTYTAQELTQPSTPHWASEKPVSRLPAKYVARQVSFTHLLMLDNFLTDAGRIHPRRRTGLPRKVQRNVARQIKIARNMALLSPIGRHPAFEAEAYQNEFDAYEDGSGNDEDGD